MKSNLEILFISGLFPKEKEEEIVNNSIGGIQNAANNLQWEIVKGLEDNLEQPITIYNSLYIGSYHKRYRKLFIKTYEFVAGNKNGKHINIGFINLPVLKNISRYISLRKYVKKWLSDNNDKQKVVIAYAMTGPFTHLLNYIKKKSTNTITCIIVPDLPDFMNLSDKKNVLFKLFNSLTKIIIESDIKTIDCFVLLTKYMANYLRLNKPYIVMEGVATDIFDNLAAPNKNVITKTILYTGGFARKYGIQDLVDAFMRLPNPNYRLVLCGKGEMENYIQEKSRIDERIKFKGLLKRDEILKLQKSSTVLINPRKNNDEFTKYSFPSKILEYMSSGTPVISYKLDGIPSEYYDYLYIVEDNSVEDLKETIEKILNKSQDELNLFGERARKFVAENKNTQVQTRKILDILEDINKQRFGAL